MTNQLVLLFVSLKYVMYSSRMSFHFFIRMVCLYRLCGLKGAECGLTHHPPLRERNSGGGTSSKKHPGSRHSWMRIQNLSQKTMCAMVKPVAILGMVIPPLMGILIMGI